MGHIYWEKQEIPIPEGAYVNNDDGRVFVFLDSNVPTRKSGRRVIGHATSKVTMHPNEYFRTHFQALWEKYYGSQDTPARHLRAGMYALTLGIGYKTGLYPDLVRSYGPLYANFLMDFAMYSILYQSNVAMNFQDKMKGSVRFSKDEAQSDSWISDVFSKEISRDMNDQFCSLWMERCRKSGISEAWLCIDGSNNDCSAQKCELAEPGHAKSKRDGDIISYMYAVTDTGLPLTYMVYRGGTIDSTAFQKVARVLADHGIRTKGVILDRGFCSHDVIVTLSDMKLPYVLMLTSNVFAYTQMMKECADMIRWNPEYTAEKDSIFGVSRRRKIFTGFPEEAYITLFYDGVNGAMRANCLMNKVNKARKSLKSEAENGKVGSVPADLQKYLSAGKKDEEITITCDYEAWKKDLNTKGFCAMASSMNREPGELDRIYHLRDASETQYAILKSQMGYSVTRAHTTTAIQSRFAACFAASIIRSEILRSSRKISNKTNALIAGLDEVEFCYSHEGLYYATHSEKGKIKDLLALYEIIPSDLDEIAKDVSNRLSNPIVSQIREMPPRERKPRKVGRPKKEKAPQEEQEKEVKRGPGRPKGSKNKKTLEKEKNATAEAVPRRRGRPRGSKTKNHKSIVVPEQKRGRGRPKGSKDTKPRKKAVRSSGAQTETTDFGV